MDDEMKRELNGIKSHLSRLDSHLEKVDARLEKIDARLEKVDAHLERVDAHLDKLNAVLVRVAASATRTESRLGDLENYVHRNLLTRKEFDARFEQFGAFVEAARRDRKNASDSYVQLADRLDAHDKRLSRLEARRA